MSRLADDLLVLARADQGRLPLHPQPLMARKLLEDAAGRAHAGAEVRAQSRSPSPSPPKTVRYAPTQTVPRRSSTT